LGFGGSLGGLRSDPTAVWFVENIWSGWLALRPFALHGMIEVPVKGITSLARLQYSL
jgi:hypothetical protein